MARGVRLLTVCLMLCCVAGLAVSPVAALGTGSSSEGSSSGSTAGSPVLLGSSLVVPGEEGLDAGQQIREQEEAQLANPEAVAERGRSRTEYERLSGADAVSLAEQKFGIQTPSWTPPGGPESNHITSYLGTNRVQETSSTGQHLLLQSSVALRSAVGSGQLEPTSYSLGEESGSYEPANPIVPVSISKTPSGGVSLPPGISFAPVQAAMPEAPSVVGDTVVYPGTATDTDYMVEPVPVGVSASWQLLSEQSSQTNGLVFNLPQGASLQLSQTGDGAAEVVKEGEVLVTIPRAAAREANGSVLPVTYTVSGDTLMTHVDLEGSVDFPVLIDPTMVGAYGALNGAGNWNPWISYSNCGCFQFPAAADQLFVGQNPELAVGDYGEWAVDAPNQRLAGGVGVTRVDVTGLGHYLANEQSSLQAGIFDSNSPDPVWTFNGFEGAMGAAPLVTEAPVTEQNAAFCAQSAGGKDNEKGEQPLCNEGAGGEGFDFLVDVGPARATDFTDAEIHGAGVTYVDNTPPRGVALIGLESIKWLRYGPTNDYASAVDEGIGVQSLSVEIPAGHLNEHGDPFFADSYSCPEIGFVGCPEHFESGAINFSELATGVYSLGVYGHDAAGNVRDEEVNPSNDEEDQGTGVAPKLYIDHTAPTFTAFSGSLKEANGGVIGSGNYTLNFGAEDGSTSAPQSGVRYLTVYVDGKYADEVNTSCPEPAGVPSASCFGLSGSWTMEGQRYGAGPHTITVTATDWMGNESTSETIHVTVNEAPYESLGPGAVNLKTGDYKLNASDVNIAGAGGDLTLSRAYDSRELSQGANGPLGPQWALSLPDAAADGEWQSLQVLPNGSVQITAATGNKVTFVPSGGSYTSPAGYQTITLTKASASEYRLTDDGGDATIFTKAGTEEYAPMFVPSGVVQASSAGGLNAMTYLFAKTTEGIIEPTAMLAPYPSSLKCSEKLTKKEELVVGCRALEFVYAEATKEKIGENETEWGEYKGRLKDVKFVASEPNGTKMAAPITVAEYVYDKLGRLRAEWNPQLTTPLKTIYGYDSEGHVTAVTSPGQQPWVFTYGTTASDLSTGRLLKVMRPAVTTAAWAGVLPAKTAAPKLTGTAVVGNKMSVSEGTWSGAPVDHGYRWTRCTGSSCVVIAGANNQSYTPATADVGHTLVAEVTATNSGGSVAVPSEASATVVSKVGALTQLVDSGNSLNAVSCIASTTDCILSDSKGKALYATNVSSTAAATWNSWSGPSGESPSQAVDCPSSSLSLLADGKETAGGELYYATSLGGSWSEAYSPSYGVDAISCVSSAFCVDGQDGEGYFRYSTSPASTSWELEDQGSASMNGAFCLSTSFCAIADSVGDVHIADSTTQVESASWTSTDVDGTTGLHGVACTSTTSCVAVDGAGNVIYLAISGSIPTATKHNIDGTNSLTAVTCTGSTTCVTVDNVGNVFVSKNKGETWTKEYALSDKLTSVSCASSSLCVTDDTTGNVTAFNPAGGTATEGEHTSPAPGATVDYNIPLSGTGLTAMTKAEVEKWGQKEDVPVEGTAIFPPNKPQSWPATEYTPATIYYLDSSERTVNVSSPTGGISTTEYDNHNNVKRALTADNRALALKEAKTAEASEKLDTKSTYNAEGTELESTLGPEHEIKLQGATEAIKARKQVKYTYNEEGAPSGGPYRLVTKTVETAKLASGKEEEPRTVTDSYSGQEGLGWKLHAPTSTSTNPGGLNLTHSTVFSPTTGMETETKMPSTTGTGNQGAHDSEIIYYTPSTEASVAICQKHSQWANLPCETQPVHQPEVSGMPEVPVTTFTYNIWDEPETTKSTSGTSTRTETDSYDAAARLSNKEIVSSTGTTLPKVSYKYNTLNGTLEKQSTGSGSEEKTITSEHNALGQLGTYTDAEGNTATYEYEKEGDAHLLKVTDGKGNQTYAYNETTGAIKELIDSTAHVFTPVYDSEGNLISEELPNGMSVTTTLNHIGEATGLVYKKTTHCTEKCEWYTDSVIPSIHGQWLSQTSTLSTNNYSYDEAGRLIQVQDTPAGKECATRSYVYDADGNRTSLKRTPASGGKCSTAGGETETHSYDTADRLIDTGTTYNPFGDILTLPAADAGGSKLTSAYYADGQLASQEQSEQTIGYQLDPARRTRETVATGKATKNTVDHYDGPGAAPSWMSYPPSSEWTRDIPGISGGLDAVQYNTETPVIQIANLHGDIVGEVLDSETATGLKSSQDTTEYGVPTTSEPLKYAWLGAGEFPTELPSGVMQMGARSYVPQLGRFLQPDPKPGGSADAYAYTYGDPLSESDPSGEWSLNETSGGLSAVGTGEGVLLPGGVGIDAGAVMPPPVNEAIEAAFNADPPWDQVAAGDEEAGGGPEGEEYEEYEEEEGEGEGEYASYKRSGESGDQEHQLGSGVLYQPLRSEASSDGTGSSTVPLCEAVASGPCARSVPNDKNKNVNSKCNNTGQDCGRRRRARGGGGNAGDTCRTVAGATGPLAVMTGPGGIILWVIGFGTCELK